VQWQKCKFLSEICQLSCHTFLKFLFPVPSIASSATYPLQVIKSRLQQRSHSLELTVDGEVEAVKREYMGMISTARKMWQREGFSGYYKGMVPNAIRVAPGAAITFVVYESVLDWLDR
jgi:hypothetical protein